MYRTMQGMLCTPLIMSAIESLKQHLYGDKCWFREGEAPLPGPHRVHLPRRRGPGQAPAGQPAAPQGEGNDAAATAEVIRSQRSLNLIPRRVLLQSAAPCPGRTDSAWVMLRGDVPQGCSTGTAPAAAHGSLPVTPGGPDSATWPRECPGRRPPVCPAAFPFLPVGFSRFELPLSHFHTQLWKCCPADQK